MPTASPSHQVIHIHAKPEKSCSLNAHSALEPLVALIIDASNDAATANTKT